MNTPPLPGRTAFFVHTPGYVVALEINGVQAIEMARRDLDTWSETYFPGYRFIEDLRTCAGYRVPNSLFFEVKWFNVPAEDRKQYEIRSPIIQCSTSSAKPVTE